MHIIEVSQKLKSLKTWFCKFASNIDWLKTVEYDITKSLFFSIVEGYYIILLFLILFRKRERSTRVYTNVLFINYSKMCVDRKKKHKIWNSECTVFAPKKRVFLFLPVLLHCFKYAFLLSLQLITQTHTFFRIWWVVSWGFVSLFFAYGILVFCLAQTFSLELEKFRKNWVLIGELHWFGISLWASLHFHNQPMKLSEF